MRGLAQNFLTSLLTGVRRPLGPIPLLLIAPDPVRTFTHMLAHLRGQSGR